MTDDVLDGVGKCIKVYAVYLKLHESVSKSVSKGNETV